LHITQNCNYQCKFCFAKYQNLTKELGLNQFIRIIDELVNCGCEKINFAGGEPTLVPFLPDLISHSHEQGLFTSIISNGTGINQEFMNKNSEQLDLIGLSIDSHWDPVEKTLGRTLKKTSFRFSHVENIKNKVDLIRDFGVPLKINSVVTPLNWNEDMTNFLEGIKPVRWKVFEIHRLKGINDGFFTEFGKLEGWQRDFFIQKHRNLNPIFESSKMILDSYCMVSPDGRFYQDTNNQHHYSQPILEYGINETICQVKFQKKKYLMRKGDYFKK
jgi:radical S-adenosyl methionine domain-containing protein 2